MSADPTRFLDWLYENNQPRYADRPLDLTDWPAWSTGLKAAVADSIALEPLQQMQTPLNPIRVTSEDCGDFRRELYQLTIAPHLATQTWLLIPAGRSPDRPATAEPMPAVLACHGHGYGVRAMIGLDPEGHPHETEPDYQKDFALSLVRQGFIVAAPEIIGFGEARREEDKHGSPEDSSCYSISTYLLMLGLTMPGLRVFQAMLNLDFLQSLPGVSTDKIGCMGISGGGLVAAFSAALDERIRAVVISGYANTFRDSIMSVFHCVDNYIPGLLRDCELPDLISLIAPRPLLIENGRQDEIFPIRAAEQALRQLRQVYELHQAADRITADFFEGEHQIHGVKAYPWLKRWLS